MTKSGAEYHTLPKCKYFNQLQFLHQKITNKETVSDFTISESAAASPSSAVSAAPSNDPDGGTLNTGNTPPPACNNVSAEPPARRRDVWKKPSITPVDSELLDVIKEMNSATKTLIASDTTSNSEDSENMLFCKSLAGTLDKMNRRDSAFAKMQIQKIIFDIEFKE